MAIFKVTAPAAGYEGMVGNVRFVDGEASIDEDRNPAELAYCRGAGYRVEDAKQAPDNSGQAEASQDGGEGQDGGDKPFDPADHNADEVLAYLNEADEAEAVRVLDAEAAGKDRRGIASQRDAILASKKKEGEDQ
jgi:hypothetical protein